MKRILVVILAGVMAGGCVSEAWRYDRQAFLETQDRLIRRQLAGQKSSDEAAQFWYHYHRFRAVHAAARKAARQAGREFDQKWRQIYGDEGLDK